MSLIVRAIVSLIAVWLTVFVGSQMGIGLEWKGIAGAIVFVIVLAIVNAVIRPLVRMFTLPLNCLTLGLFAFVVNAVLFWLVAALTGGIVVKGFVAALFGSVVLSILSGIINSLVRTGRRGS